ncbi:MAG: hypothetical protein KC635_16040 [Myxococcales bacterium]|nr:hypothetical protein [Myxococcales bacterium]MCB9733243.1 hypothetical protein [Deltaproteobacteria bacterium]
MRLQNRLHLVTTAALAAALGLGAAACDAGGTTGTTTTNDDPNTVAYAGFALTGDEASDDSFTDDANPEPLIDALGDAMGGDEGEEVPSADEVDPGELDEDVADEGPDVIARTVLFVWGKPIADPDFEATTTWRGGITTSVGRVRPLRKVRFEATDHLVRDGDPQIVAFSTVTGPHHDGVLVRLVVPRRMASLGGTLSFRTGVFQKSVPIADLLDGYHEAFRVDDAGNALLVSTVMAHRCPHGLMRLRWERKDARGGIFGGKVFGHDGALVGRVAGVWGKVGERRLFKGFFLGPMNERRGVLKGSYAPFPDGVDADGGAFRGVWTLRGREVQGVLAGMYRVAAEGGEGMAQGHWLARCLDGAAPSCDVDLALPAPPAPDCACEPDAENADADLCACVMEPGPDACVRPEPLSTERPSDAPAE